MAEPQPPNVVEGATTGDVDEEVPAVAKSAEDRKAAAALSSLDRKEDESGGKEVDQEAVKKAMARLTGTTVTNGTSTESKEKAAPKKIIKVDASDVNLLVSSRIKSAYGRTSVWRFLDR